MANERLPMRKIRDVLRLRAEGLSQRDIGLSLGVSRGSVRAYLVRASEVGLSWPLPDDLSDEGLETRLFPPPDNDADQERAQPDWALLHKERRKPHVTLALLWEEYRVEHPDGYGYSRYCELYRRWKGKLSSTMRQTHVAGEKLFVDYSGASIPVVDPKTGEVRKTELFIAALGASNYTYAEVTWTQSLVDWTGSHVRAFEYFGGVPQLVVPDNLKSGVIKACFAEPKVNRTYADLARHYNTAVLPARPYKPRDKAKAEVAVQIAQRWILARLRNETFTSIEELNEAIRGLLEDLNNRVTRHLGASRRELFEQLDQPELKSLPAYPYSYAAWEHQRVGLDYHLKIEGHHYSVPHQLLRRKLWARITAHTVEMFDNNGKRVATHMRSNVEGGQTACKEHMPSAHRRYADWTPDKLRHKASEVGASTAILIDILMREKPHPEQGFRAGIGIVGLAKSFGNDRLEAACERAINIGARSFSSVKSILNTRLDRRKPKRAADGPAIIHPNIRGSRYFH
jgi:transposase